MMKPIPPDEGNADSVSAEFVEHVKIGDVLYKIVTQHKKGNELGKLLDEIITEKLGKMMLTDERCEA